MIEIDGLTKRFGSILAVDRLSLSVKEGELIGLLGPNGAGKTTTVRLLSCLIAPTAGRATIHGLVVGRDNRRIRSIVGILTASPGLYERLSPLQNLAFYARLYGMDEGGQSAQVEYYLRAMDLWDRRNDPVGGFSKGMQQKIAIARALIHEPKVVFLDEPTSALDPESASVVREFIAELRSQGRTVFLATHNLDEADRLCDRIAIVKQRLIRIGTPAELRTELYGRRVEVALREATDTVTQAVKRLPFVRQVEVEEGRLLVSIDDPEEQNPALIRAIVEAGGEVQFVSETRHSLEEVYLRLVKEGRETEES